MSPFLFTHLPTCIAHLFSQIVNVNHSSDESAYLCLASALVDWLLSRQECHEAIQQSLPRDGQTSQPKGADGFI